MSDVTVSGWYRGTSESGAPLVGVLVEGPRAVLKWFAPADAAMAGVWAGRFAVGDRITCRLALDRESQRMLLVEVAGAGAPAADTPTLPGGSMPKRAKADEAARGADEGVIKFECAWTRCDCLGAVDLADLRRVRVTMRELGLVGADPAGLGFGNLSKRAAAPECLPVPGRGLRGFVVTGSQTGHLADPGAEAYSFVYEWSIGGNRLACAGLAKASSESLTHAALYEASPEVLAVIHVHDAGIWEAWADEDARTDPGAAYGTPAMAEEIRRVYLRGGRRPTGAICMAGHRDGIVAWGRSLDEACATILALNHGRKDARLR